MKTDHTPVDKAAIRLEMRRRREEMPLAEVRSCSAQIVNKLQQLKPVRDARIIMGYMSMRHEVDLNPWWKSLARTDRTLLLPRVHGREIQAVRFTADTELQKSSYGILEPVGAAWDPQHIDAVVVPGLAFDYRGYRIGYGKGYYDRFLPRLRKDAFLCGVCYEFQVIASCGPADYDCPVNWIVTERSELMIDERFF